MTRLQMENQTAVPGDGGRYANQFLAKPMDIIPTFYDLKRAYCAGSRPTITQIQEFVDSDPDLNYRDCRESTLQLNRGQTILHWAAEHGHTDAIHILVDCGANVDARADDGRTPLHLAVEHDFDAATQNDHMPHDFPTAAALLKHAADDSICDADGQTAIEFLSDFDGILEVYQSVKSRVYLHQDLA